MSVRKFEKGDVVLIIGASANGYTDRIGDTAEILRVYEGEGNVRVKMAADGKKGSIFKEEHLQHPEVPPNPHSEPKFKVGDVVEVIGKTCGGYDDCLGQIGPIVEVVKDDPGRKDHYVVKVDIEDRHPRFYEYSLRLATVDDISPTGREESEPNHQNIPPAEKPQFQVGDRVKIVGPSRYGRTNRQNEITTIDGRMIDTGDLTVLNKKGSDACIYPPSSLELVCDPGHMMGLPHERSNLPVEGGTLAWGYTANPTEDPEDPTVPSGKEQSEESGDLDIQVGDVWRMRSGDDVRIESVTHREDFPIRGYHTVVNTYRTWQKNGNWSGHQAQHEYDLMELVSRKDQEVKNLPDPGEGWRPIDKEVDEPQPGDQWYAGIGWKDRHPDMVTSHFLDNIHYRRRIQAVPVIEYTPTDESPKDLDIREGDVWETRKGTRMVIDGFYSDGRPEVEYPVYGHWEQDEEEEEKWTHSGHWHIKHTGEEHPLDLVKLVSRREEPQEEIKEPYLPEEASAVPRESSDVPKVLGKFRVHDLWKTREGDTVQITGFHLLGDNKSFDLVAVYQTGTAKESQGHWPSSGLFSDSDESENPDDLTELIGRGDPNSKYFKVGDTWRTRDGDVVTVEKLLARDAYPIVGSDGMSRRLDGLWLSDDEDDVDLVEMVPKAEKQPFRAGEDTLEEEPSDEEVEEGEIANLHARIDHLAEIATAAYQAVLGDCEEQGNLTERLLDLQEATPDKKTLDEIRDTLQERVYAVEMKINEESEIRNDAFGHTSARLDGCHQAFAAIRELITGIDSRVNRNTNEVDNATANIADMYNRFAAEIGNLTPFLADHNTRINVNAGKIGTLECRLRKIEEGNVSRDEWEQNIQDKVEEAIDTTAGTFGTFDLRMREIEDQISRLPQRVEEMDNDLHSHGNRLDDLTVKIDRLFLMFGQLKDQLTQLQTPSATDDPVEDSLTFEDVWSQFCGDRIVLDKPDASIEFPVSDLKNLLRRTFEQGRQGKNSVEEYFDNREKDLEQMKEARKNHQPFGYPGSTAHLAPQPMPQDDLWVEFAKVALHYAEGCVDPIAENAQGMADWASAIADAMMTEYKKRQGGEE